MNLTDEERRLVMEGLQMKICFIETHNPLLRAIDVKNCPVGAKVMVLNSDQMRLIIKMEDLIVKIGDMETI